MAVTGLRLDDEVLKRNNVEAGWTVQSKEYA
jgi:hypothetical protein